MLHIPILDKNIHKTIEWIYSISELAELEEGQENQAFLLLRVTLHQLRDNLPLTVAAHLSAQLPLFIRGLFFEGWNPENTPLKERKKEEFLASIAYHLPFKADLDVEKGVQAIFQTLSCKISPGESEKLRKVLPEGIRQLWSEL